MSIKRGNQTLNLIKVQLHVEFDIISKKGVSNIYFIALCQTKEMTDVEYLKYVRKYYPNTLLFVN